MSRQANARNAVWSAIEAWAPLNAGGASVFARLYKFDDDDGPEINPDETLLPAIAIWPDPSAGDIVLNKTHEHPYPLAVLIWTHSWKLETAEQYVEDVLNAIWRAKAGGNTVEEVRRVTGFPPMNPFRVNYYRQKLQNAKAILTVLRVTLRLRFNPQG